MKTAKIHTSWRPFVKRLEPQATATEALPQRDLGTIGQNVVNTGSAITIQTVYNRLVGKTTFTLGDLGEACKMNCSSPVGSEKFRAFVVGMFLAGRIVEADRGRGSGEPVADRVNALAKDAFKF